MADPTSGVEGPVTVKVAKRAASSPDESPVSVKKAKLSTNMKGRKDTSTEDPSMEKHEDASTEERQFQSKLKKSKSDEKAVKKELKHPEDQKYEPEEKEKKKQYHKRMKHTLNCVLEQMEFYFGDSSLSKDRFLKAQVDSSPDGYVDLSVFGKFNKLQSLHKDGISLKMLTQALSRSTMLQLNEDKTKVKRITPFKQISQEETDKRTVYVEHLPSHATHAWVTKIFSQCGKVAYVSLPIYPSSKHIKGFAFVEFETAEEAERACTMLNNPVPEKASEPPGKFPKGNKTLERLQKLAPPQPVQDNNEDKDTAQDMTEASKSTTDQETKKKKKKTSKRKKLQDPAVDEAPASSSTAAKEGKKKKKKKKRKLSQTQEQTATGEESLSEQKEATGVDPDVTCQTKGRKESSTVAETDGSKHTESKIVPEKDESAMKEPTSKLVDKTEEEQLESTLTKKKKKKKKKLKTDKAAATEVLQSTQTNKEERMNPETENAGSEVTTKVPSTTSMAEGRLSHRERKLLRQEDIRRKQQLRLEGTETAMEGGQAAAEDPGPDPVKSDATKTDTKADNSQPTSILKNKKAAEKKRVEFDPVPITTEFVEARGARRRKKNRREKCHLRVLSKKDWLSLKEEYISQQRSHMQALKESLRELRQQEMAEAGQNKLKRGNPMDLEDVFGTKALKLSRDERLAHIEELKFTPNVIVQWWCTHEMHRDKIRTMFKETHAQSIAYIDAAEEARSGYIRFKDETSAEEFTKMARNATPNFIMARVLPANQQVEYWEKVNKDRMEKLSRKKKEQGSDRLARKVFQRNKATFFNKPSRIVFDDADDDEDGEVKDTEQKEESVDNNEEVKEERESAEVEEN